MKLFVILLLLVIGQESVFCYENRVQNQLEIPLPVINDAEVEIISGVQEFSQTGVLPESLVLYSEQINMSPDLAQQDFSKYNYIQKELMCIMCKASVQVALDFVGNTSLGENGNSNIFERIIIDLCVTFNIQTREVCTGLVKANWPILIYIIRKQHSQFDRNSFCSVIMQGNKCGNVNSNYNWSISIDYNDEIPKVNRHKEIPKNSTNSEKLKILVLSDIHYDPLYVKGSNADCKEPLCCRQPMNSGKRRKRSKGAGYWSDYRKCDVPWDLLEHTVNHIAEKHKNFHYIYFTGDIVDHGIWNQSREGNTESIKTVLNLLKNTFPNTPIFPILGNHETYPVNQYAPSDITDPKYSTQWLYDLAGDEWKTWLSEPSSQRNIRKGGYYSYSPRRGFRIIALNNNEAYTFNFWLSYNPSYLMKQLQWLHDVLLGSEISKEYVHILMHVPSGDATCFNIWSREFRRIVERYHQIIGGIFVGHTHFDEFNVYYSIESPQHAIGVSWNGGSLTPYEDVNPNYRIYEVETETYQVVKHETYIYNLTEANSYPSAKPNWYKEYSFGDFYKLQDLSPRSLDGLLKKFSRNSSLLKEYWKLKVKQGDSSLIKGCDKKCLRQHYCEIVTTQFDDQKKCVFR